MQQPERFVSESTLVVMKNERSALKDQIAPITAFQLHLILFKSCASLAKLIENIKKRLDRSDTHNKV